MGPGLTNYYSSRNVDGFTREILIQNSYAVEKECEVTSRYGSMSRRSLRVAKGINRIDIKNWDLLPGEVI